MASKQATNEESGENNQQQTGILGSIMKSVGDTYEQAKGAVTSKYVDTIDTSVGQKTGDVYENYGLENANEMNDFSSDEKARRAKDTAIEAKDRSMQKAGEYKDYAMDRMKEAADATMEKAGEYKDYTTEKTKEETNIVASRMAEMKESATSALRKAMDNFTGKAGELDQKALEGGDINTEKYGETEFKAREKMQEMKLNEEGVYDEAKQRAAADRETAADRGIAARKNIYGAVGSVKQAIKDKLTYPTDIVHEARASRVYGGPKRAPKEKLVDDVEGGPSGPAAMPTFKTSD